MEYESDSDTSYKWCTQNDPERLGKGTGKIGNRKTSREHSNYSITKIGQSTENSPGDLQSFWLLRKTIG